MVKYYLFILGKFINTNGLKYLKNIFFNYVLKLLKFKLYFEMHFCFKISIREKIMTSIINNMN